MGKNNGFELDFTALDSQSVTDWAGDQNADNSDDDNDENEDEYEEDPYEPEPWRPTARYPDPYKARELALAPAPAPAPPQDPELQRFEAVKQRHSQDLAARQEADLLRQVLVKEQQPFLTSMCSQAQTHFKLDPIKRGAR